MKLTILMTACDDFTAVFPRKAWNIQRSSKKKTAVSVFPGLLGKGKQDINIEMKVNETEVKGGTRHYVEEFLDVTGNGTAEMSSKENWEDSFIAKDPCFTTSCSRPQLLSVWNSPRHIFQLRVHGPALVDVRWFHHVALHVSYLHMHQRGLTTGKHHSAWQNAGKNGWTSKTHQLKIMHHRIIMLYASAKTVLRW